ncbi:MAG TPA: hypothetical protein VKB95_04040, partial [Chitinophagaceae bacterium]|nr:hypothetical protein [Chitinophagaceae bacterium]
MKKITLIFLTIIFSGNGFGQITFQKTYGGFDNDQGNYVSKTSEGGYIIAGTTYSFGAGDRDIYVIKTDSMGNVAWTKTFGTGNDDRCYTVIQTFDGGYILSGLMDFPSTALQFLLSMDSLGNLNWVKGYYYT